jgi:hypothetical protein
MDMNVGMVMSDNIRSSFCENQSNGSMFEKGEAQTHTAELRGDIKGIFFTSSLIKFSIYFSESRVRYKH